MSLRYWRAIDKVSYRSPRSSANGCRYVGDQCDVPGTLIWCPRSPSCSVTTSSRRRREVSGRLLFRSCRNDVRQGYKLKPLFAQARNEPIQGADRLTLVPVEPPHVTVVENDDGARLNSPQHSRSYDFRARPGYIDREHVADHSAIPQLFDRVEGALGE